MINIFSIIKFQGLVARQPYLCNSYYLAEDIMADNSPSPRALSTIIAIISEVTGYNYFISYLPIP